MKKFTKIMAVVLAVVCVFSMFTIGVSAAEKDNVCTIKLESSKSSIKPGDSFTVTVSAKTNYPVLNVNVMIAYDKDYFEDINLTQEEFYALLTEGAEISTSMPEPGSVTDLWDKTLEEYDEIVYIPMSSGLSSSCLTINCNV